MGFLWATTYYLWYYIYYCENKRSSAKKFYTNNPDVSIIYNVFKRFGEFGSETIRIKKLDAKSPHFESETGFYALAGQRELEFVRAWFPKRNVIKSEALPPLTVNIKKNTGKCQIIEIPNYENLVNWK